MRVVIDAVGADYGGIRTYVVQLLDAWERALPDDELHVLVERGSTLPVGVHRRHELRVRRPRPLGRPWAQTLAVRRVVRAVDPDVVLATLPSTTVLRQRRPLVVVVHDLRHERRPDQFRPWTRLLRKVSYGRTYRLAAAFVAISSRTLHDLHELHPGTRRVPCTVVHHGADHVLGWPAGSQGGPAIAFAHHTNKNPDLILDAWALLAQRGSDPPPLTIVGLSDEHRLTIAAHVERRALSDLVTLAPYLPEDAFRRTMASAQMVVFPSDFEGFGLPVVEGMLLGVPVVIGPEPATIEIAGGHAVVIEEWTSAALADAVTMAGATSEGARRAATVWARGFTWDKTVRETRRVLEAASGSGNDH